MTTSNHTSRTGKVWLPVAIAAGMLVLVIVAILLTPTRKGSPENSTGETPDIGVAMVGSVAPDFKLRLLDDSLFEMSQHRGKVVLINFWGTWCTPCEKEMPHLVDAHGRYRQSAVFIGIAVNDIPASVRNFIKDKKVDFAIGLDEGQIAGRYLVSGFPTTVIVGIDGVVKEKIARAFPDLASIESALERAGARPDISSDATKQGQEPTATTSPQTAST